MGGRLLTELSAGVRAASAVRLGDLSDFPSDFPGARGAAFTVSCEGDAGVVDSGLGRNRHRSRSLRRRDASGPSPKWTTWRDAQNNPYACDGCERCRQSGASRRPEFDSSNLSAALAPVCPAFFAVRVLAITVAKYSEQSHPRECLIKNRARATRGGSN